MAAAVFWVSKVEIHGDANLKNLKRIKKKGQDKFIEGKRDW